MEKLLSALAAAGLVGSSVLGGGAGSASTTGRVGVESADLEDLEDLGLREA